MKYGRVLLADRHLNLLGGIHGLLEEEFASVLMVADETSLRDALAVGNPELVIVDLSLPAAGGEPLVLSLLRQYPGLRVILLSLHDEPTVAEGMVAAGVAGFVLKRTAGTDLLPAIRAVMHGETYVCPAVKAASPP